MCHRGRRAVNDSFRAEYGVFLQILAVFALVRAADTSTGAGGLILMSGARAKTIGLLTA